MHARSPNLPFLAAPAKGKYGNYKKRFIHAYTREESLQAQPTSPKIEKPMPPLEPLPQAFVSNHPPLKKRLQTEHDDPMLSEAAASPSSFSDIDTKNQLMSVHMPSTPNSPWSMLSLPDTFSDSAYSSSSLMSPMNYVSSPGSITQANSPVDFFPSTPLPTAPKVSSPNQSDLQKLQNDPTALASAIEQQQEQVDQKQCPRPQSVALDLTSLQKQKVISNCTPSYPFSQQPPHLVSAPPNHSPTPPLLSEQKMNDIRMGFQGVHGSQARGIPQTNHPLLSKPCFGDRPLESSPYVGPPKIMYAGTHQHGSISSRMHRHLEGGGVIRPKPACVYPRSPPNHYIHPMSQRMKHLQHLYPGSQSRRMSHDVIYNSPRMPREMPNVSLPTPTASSKKLPWLHDNETHPSDHTSPPANPPGKPGYIEKPIVDWTHQDVVYYMIDSSRSLTSLEQDVNCSALGDITGRDLWHKTLEDFKLYSPNAAEHLYHHFSERREKERRQQERRQHAVMETGPIYHDLQNTRKLETGPFDFINEASNVIHPPHQGSSHPLQHPSPSTLPPVLRGFASGCDAPATYEIRYETYDAGALHHGILPSASNKRVDFLSGPPTPLQIEADESISDPDQSCTEEEVKPEPPKKRGPGRPRKPENELKKKKKKTGRLWEFIRNLLLDPETCPSLVRWENPEEGIFRFVQAEKVAQRWGERKKNKDMNYEKLSRAMRYYYKGGVFEAVLGRRLVYKFGKKAKDWQPPNPNFVNHNHFPGSSYSNL